MALMIIKGSIICGACEYECPNDAIYSGEFVYEINSEPCTECVGLYGEPQCMSA